MNPNHDELSWEEVPCDGCGNYESRAIFTGPDLMHHLPGQFTFVQCLHCGTYRQNPRLAWDSLRHYYPDTYTSYIPQVSEIHNPLRRLDKRYGSWKRMRAVERHQPGGLLLDVGCGTGLLLEEALRSGKWNVTGIEPSKQAAVYVRQKLNIPVIQDTFSNAALPSEAFDAIVFWNVLEHTYHPVEDLKKAYSALKPGGWVVIGIPSVESWEKTVFGPSWVGWELPRHLYLFPQKTLREILEGVGFRWEGAHCISSSHAVLGLSLNFWSQGWENNHPALRRLLLQVYNSLFGRLLLLLPLWISDQFNRSTIIAFFVQKPADID